MIVAIQVGGRLPGHVDLYDAIGVTDEFEEVGLYQAKDRPYHFYNSVRGIFVDKELLEI